MDGVGGVGPTQKNHVLVDWEADSLLGVDGVKKD